MILYEYECFQCEGLTEAMREIDDRDISPECQHCGGRTRKIISAYRVHGDLSPYYDDNLETYITSKQHRKAVMSDQGVSENFGQNWHTSSVKRRHRE